MQKSLQKSVQSSNDIPKGVLNPFNAAKHYTVRSYNPSAGLAPFIEHFWILRWDLRPHKPFVCEVIPYPSVNLTFMAEGARITGVVTGKYSYEMKDAGVVLGVKFWPGGFHPFWQQSVSRLTDTAMPASHILPEVDDHLNTVILSLKTDEEMIDHAETLLLNKRPVIDENILLVNDIIGKIKNDTTVHTVRSLTEQFGIHERSLQKLFHTYVGVGAKWVIMRFRLQEAAELATRTDRPNWTTISADLGYSSQSHFTNDFRRIIGKSPSQYAIEASSPPREQKAYEKAKEQ